GDVLRLTGWNVGEMDSAHHTATRHRGIRLAEIKGAPDVFLEPIESVPLPKRSAIVIERSGFDAPCSGDGKGRDLHWRSLARVPRPRAVSRLHGARSAGSRRSESEEPAASDGLLESQVGAA